MLSSITSQQASHRQSSISNSTSSSSVITVQRAGSLSSRSGSRPPAAPQRAQSPTEATGRPAKWTKRSVSPAGKHHPSAAHSPSSSLNGVCEGVGNLNRWSQSSTSSKSSKEHTRRHSFSRRLSFGGSGPFSTNSIGGYASSPPKKALANSKLLTGKSPPKQHPPTLALNLPVTSLAPIVTLPTLSQAVDAADSPSTVASITPSTAELLTPSTYSSATPDYFGEKWHGRSSQQRPIAFRTKTAPIPTAPTIITNVSPHARGLEPLRPITSSGPASRSQSEHGAWSNQYRQQDLTSRPRNLRVYDKSGNDGNGRHLQSSASSTRSREPERDRGERHPKQKAMLSKALQKANTAVLLDNALNFEGAMDAYGDACMLLQHVMSRSSGEDDRRKLESIVRHSSESLEFEIGMGQY